MSAKIFNFTKAALDALPPAPPGGRLTYHDTKAPGLQIRVTPTGLKTFSVYRWVKGAAKPQRVTLGRYPQMTIEQARAKTAEVNAIVEGGGNPVDERKARRAQAVTLGEAFQAFLSTRKNLSPRTIYDYQRLMGLHAEEDRTDPNRARHKPRRSAESFANWLAKPLSAITKDMVERRHAQMGEISPAQANYAMRVLRAVFNFAAIKYENSKGQPLVAENPVRRLSQARAWYRVGRKQTVIRSADLKPWFDAVLALSSDAVNGKADVVRDYLQFILLTGVRRNEAAKLRWENADLQGCIFTIQDTKNKQPHTLPMSDYLHDLLITRQATSDSPYVFPGTGKGGYLVEPKRQIAKVIEASGVPFTLHDLRRTFITVAESLDIPAYALKRLLNHKMSNDVTAGYIVTDVERLRAPMQKITDYILRAAGLRVSAPIAKLGKRGRRATT